MDPAGSSSGLVRLVSALALGLGVALPLVELQYIASFADARTVASACACTAVFLPLHLWHLRFGLRGLKPPRAGWTLMAMALAITAGAVSIGSPWALMLAVLASSVLIVVDLPWAVLLVGALLLGAFVLGDAATGVAAGRPGPYLALAVAFRSVTLFVLVWFAAAVWQLDRARSAVAGTAASTARRRADQELAGFAARDLTSLGDHAQQARERFQAGDTDAAKRVLGELAEASRRAHQRLREIARDVRAGSVPDVASSTNPLRLTAAGSASPVERALGAARHSRRILVAVHVPIIVFFMALTVTGLGFDAFPTLPAAVAVPAGLALGALQLAVSFTTGRGRRPRHATAAYCVAWALALGPALAYGYSWSLSAWFVAAIGAMLARHRVTQIVAFTAPIALWIANDLRMAAETGAGPIDLLATATYTTTIGIAGAGGLFAAARLTDVVDGLVAARVQQAVTVMREERERISRDLHDLLSQTLSALALTADLAGRLLERDPPAARDEIERLSAVAARLSAQLDSVAHASGSVSLAGEAHSGAALLRMAGAQVEVRLGAGKLPPATDALLGWAVREAVTNILRHSRPRRCSITSEHVGERGRVDIVNDGVAPTAVLPGRGLANLSERLRLAGGAVRATATGDGGFRLQAEVPHCVPAEVTRSVA